MTRPVIHIHNCKEALAVERAAYFGGRCDVFRLGRIDNTIYEYDVNSLYPSVMAENLFPCRLLAVEQSPTISNLERWLQDEKVCCTCLVRSRWGTYPYRDSQGSRNALGEFCTNLCTPEVKRAISEGSIIRVYAACRYTGRDLFSKYVDSLYGLRNARRDTILGDDGAPYKLLMNSLYGKFAQHGEQWASVDTVRPLRLWGEWSEWDPGAQVAVNYRAIGGVIEQSISEGEWLHSFPAIAAHVTSYGRERLRNLILTAGVDNVYYADTDSVHSNANGKSRLDERNELHPTRLGALRLECEASEGEYRGRKYYRLGGECVTAGASFGPKDWTEGVCLLDRKARCRAAIQSGPQRTIAVRSERVTYHDRHMRGEVLADGRVLPEIVGDVFPLPEWGVV